MQYFSCKTKPIEVHGIWNFDKTGSFDRLPPELKQQAKFAGSMSAYSVGARICFATDSKHIYLKMITKPTALTTGMSPMAGQSLHALFGDRKNPFYAGAWTLSQTGATKVEGTTPFIKKEVEKDVTIYLPRNAIVEEVTIGIDDGATLLPPTPYKYPPILYYGSSITAGGSCSAPFCAYTSIISHHLDVDYYNFGFSGSCMGELPLADYFAEIPMSIFVYDYDHNAPDVAFLEKTHEAFFLRFREKQPNVPVVMISKPDCFGFDIEKERRAVIEKTYNNAIKNGDKNVYFINGGELFGNTDRFACTVDCLHPNDVGHRRMANVVEPVLSKILKELYPDK